MIKKLWGKIDILIWILFAASLIALTIARWRGQDAGDFSSVSTRVCDAVGISFLQALGLCLALMAIKIVIIDSIILKKEIKDDEQKKQKGA